MRMRVMQQQIPLRAICHLLARGAVGAHAHALSDGAA